VLHGRRVHSWMLCRIGHSYILPKYVLPQFVGCMRLGVVVVQGEGHVAAYAAGCSCVILSRVTPCAICFQMCYLPNLIHLINHTATSTCTAVGWNQHLTHSAQPPTSSVPATYSLSRCHRHLIGLHQTCWGRSAQVTLACCCCCCGPQQRLPAAAPLSAAA
jgi:hypothetical protein